MSCKVAIIGADGNVGHCLYLMFKNLGYDVTRFGRRLNNDLLNYVYFDLENCINYLYKIDYYDIFIYCAGLSKFEDCRKFPNLSYSINVESAIFFANICKFYGSKFIYLSTNAVHPCDHNNVNPNFDGKPLGIYGLHKKISENSILDLKSNNIIFRFSKIMSLSDQLFQKWKINADKNQKVHAFIDHHVAPVSMNDVCNCILFLSQNNNYGVFQLSGDENISYYELCKKYFKKYNLNENLIKSEFCDKDFDKIKFATMNSERILKMTRMVQPSLKSVLNL